MKNLSSRLISLFLKSFSLILISLILLTSCKTEDSLSPSSNDKPTNQAPVANAGPDQTVDTGTLVNLDATGSYSLNNSSISYLWSIASAPPGSSATLSSSTTSNPTFTPDNSGVYTLNLVVNDGTLNSVINSMNITSNNPASDLDEFNGSGELTGYTINNKTDLPDITQTGGRYRAVLTDNSGDKTLHYNNVQGRLDAKLVNFPFVVIAKNIGIGTIADSQTAPTPNGSQFIFAGIQVHVLTLTEKNSSHIVVGHRGGTAFTIEGKNTLNGSSSVDDIGSNKVPNGRADIKVVGNANKTITILWRLSGASTWILYDGYNVGGGVLPGSAPTYGASVYVGLITYAQGSSNIPFVGTCDSFEIID